MNVVNIKEEKPSGLSDRCYIRGRWGAETQSWGRWCEPCWGKPEVHLSRTSLLIRNYKGEREGGRRRERETEKRKRKTPQHGFLSPFWSPAILMLYYVIALSLSDLCLLLSL